jgi:DEAD/DEAH box helicase domain-containing protein
MSDSPNTENTEPAYDDSSGPLTEEAIEQTFPDYEGQITAVETIPAEESETRPAEDHLPSQLAEATDKTPYTHQADALDALGQGENVTVATSTASGKTWIYGIHMARKLLENESATGLFLYPTKALSQDQKEELQELYDEELGLDLDILTYDGDQEQDVKQYARANADVIISNFAGMNVYLEQHARWSDFFKNLELMVVDESHTYKGILGMNVAWIIRRIKRVAHEYGSDPQFVCTTATIGNPEEHTQRLIGDQTTVIDNDGSPSGERNILFWNPPMPEPGTESDGKTSQAEAAALLAHLGVNDVQTLMFTRSRKGAELASKKAIRARIEHPSQEYLQVEPYHAGRGKQSRYAVEQKLKQGILDGVISTSALELGINIGGVEAVVLEGYPGTRQSFYQRIGRAGRDDEAALAALVARREAIDQYVVENPEYVLDDPVEDAVIDLSNNQVYARHVLCAADELPLREDDREWFDGDRLGEAVEMWQRAGQITGDLQSGAIYNGSPRPQMDVDLYAASDTQFTLQRSDNGDIDHDPVDKSRAYRDYHEGAIFLHGGQQYRVQEIDEGGYTPTITVTKESVNEYTQSIGDTAVRDLESEKYWTTSAEVDGDEFEVEVHVGTGTVVTEYSMFNQIRISTGEVTRQGVPIDLPPLEMQTQLMWLNFPDELMSRYLTAWDPTDEPAATEENAAIMQQVIGGGLHAAEHALIKTAPLELRLSKSNLGGLSSPHHSETQSATLFVYDGIEGGLGFAHRIADELSSVSERAADRVTSCDCDEGCPACVMDSQCGDRNNPLFPVLGGMLLSDLS